MEKKILLVDDEKDIRDVLRLPLMDLGFEVLEAENGEDALRLFENAQPPMILTDIKMPGMDGIELLQKVKHVNPETEVIMITGHGDMDLAVKSLKYDATDFITKPINVDVLEIALRRAAERILTRQKPGVHPEPRTLGGRKKRAAKPSVFLRADAGLHLACAEGIAHRVGCRRLYGGQGFG